MRVHGLTHPPQLAPNLHLIRDVTHSSTGHPADPSPQTLNPDPRPPLNRNTIINHKTKNDTDTDTNTDPDQARTLVLTPKITS